MRVRDVAGVLEDIAPLRYAADWDNVGLLLGADDDRAARVLLTIDLTAPVLEEALANRTDMLVAYHPPIFQPWRALTDRQPAQRLILQAARAGISIYSPHTALDAAKGGINDWLAEALGSGDVRALETAEVLPATEQCKFVTFCPPDAAELIRCALATAGAGRIGNYQLCSFEIRGHGTFLGGEGSKPAVGEAGRLERVEEVRLEMVAPAEALGLLVSTLRQFHPYEEPPIEIYPLRPRPLRGIGQGRRVVLDHKLSMAALAQRLKGLLGLRHMQSAPAHAAPRRYGTIGLCAGSGGALLEAALQQGCEAYITGEMKHHDVLAAQARGCTVFLTGHTNSERGYLRILRKRLLEALPELEVEVSRQDRDPLRVV